MRLDRPITWRYAVAQQNAAAKTTSPPRPPAVFPRASSRIDRAVADRGRTPTAAPVICFCSDTVVRTERRRSGADNSDGWLRDWRNKEGVGKCIGTGSSPPKCRGTPPRRGPVADWHGRNMTRTNYLSFSNAGRRRRRIYTPFNNTNDSRTVPTTYYNYIFLRSYKNVLFLFFLYGIVVQI